MDTCTDFMCNKYRRIVLFLHYLSKQIVATLRFHLGMGNSNTRHATYTQYYETLKKENGGTMPTLSMDLSGVNPYEILGVRKSYTWDELKEAYRRMAKVVHPDKGGSEQLFQLVTDCFRQLATEFKLRQDQKHHHELKQEANTYYSDRPVATREAGRDTSHVADEQFLDKFNRMFEENKLNLEDDQSIGYGHMMEKSNPNRDDINVPQMMKKFNKNKFNDIFEKSAPLSKEIIVHKEPEALPLGRKMQYTELGGKLDDFSSTSEGTGAEGKGLQYTDYMKAHTTTRLVDPRAVTARKEYKNVEEYESARARVLGKKMTNEEKRFMEEKKRQEEAREEERLRRLKERDGMISQHYETVNRLRLK